MNRWSTWAFGLLALSCCPEPEGCLESPGTLRYRIEGFDTSESSDASCGPIDLEAGEVTAFEKVRDYYPPSAERQCAACPIIEVAPTGEVEGWTDVNPVATNEEYGRIVSQFEATVDGCAAEILVRLGPADRGKGQPNYWMYRRITWQGGCPEHTGSCYDEFLMTELPAEE